LDVHRGFREVAIAEAGECARRDGWRPRRSAWSCSPRAFTRAIGWRSRCGSAWEVARILEPHVAKVVVVSPADTGISQARAKTDRLDARTLARLLAAGEFEDYAHQQPSLTAKKLRLLEVRAGAPTLKGKRTGVWANRAALRDAERRLAEQAEASYARMVPATGRRLGRPRRRWARA